MSAIKSYRDLRVWQQAVELSEKVFSLCDQIDNSERFGIVSQMKRSSISVASNIAEGWGRELSKSFVNFLRISKGSLFELDTQLEIAKRTGIIKDKDYEEIVKVIESEGKMINNLILSLKSKSTYLKESISDYEVLNPGIQSPRTNHQSQSKDKKGQD